eukprot:10173183-Ditylum_brightwellii.AAC.1
MATIMHPSCVNTQEEWFKEADWIDFYGEVAEEIPADRPEPLGNPVQMTAWFDSDHVGNLVTQQSQT